MPDILLRDNGTGGDVALSDGVVDRSTSDVSNLGPIRTPIKRRVNFERTSNEYNDQVQETTTAVDTSNGSNLSSRAVTEVTSSLDTVGTNQVSTATVQEIATAADTQTSGGGIYSGTVNEVVTATDAESAQAVFGDSILEPSGGTTILDSTDATLLTGRTTADVSNLGPLRTPIKRRTGFDRSGLLSDDVLESTSAVDSSTSAHTHNATIAESGSAVDASNSETDRSLADVSALGPLRTPIKRRVDFARAIEHIGLRDEITSATDTQSVGAVFTVTVTEIGSASDASTALQLIADTVAELSGLIDVTETITNRDAADVSASGPMGMPFRRYTSFARETISDQIETAVLSDTQDAVLIIGGAVIESTSAADTYTALLIITSAVSEVTTTSETQNALATFVSGVAEATVSAETQTISAILNDSVLEIVASDDDSEANFLGQQSDIVEETVTCTDSQNSTGSLGVVVNESASIVESVDAAKTISEIVAELISVLDSQQAFQAFMSQVLETSALNDSTDAIPEFGNEVNESLNAQDYSSTSGLSLETVNEATAFAEASTAYTQFIATAIDNANAVDLTNSTKIVVGVNLDGDRTYIVPLEVRRYDVEAEDRMYVVPDQERSVPV